VACEWELGDSVPRWLTHSNRVKEGVNPQRPVHKTGRTMLGWIILLAVVVIVLVYIGVLVIHL
jgi:hypothetical protein